MTWIEIWTWVGFGFLLRFTWDHREAAIDVAQRALDRLDEMVGERDRQREAPLLGGETRFRQRDHVRLIRGGDDEGAA